MSAFCSCARAPTLPLVHLRQVGRQAGDSALDRGGLVVKVCGQQAAHLRQLTGSLKVGCSIQSDKMPVILTEAANQLGINIKGKTWLHVALLAASECYGQITNTPVKQRPRFETAEEAKRHLDQAIATRHVRTAPA